MRWGVIKRKSVARITIMASVDITKAYSGLVEQPPFSLIYKELIGVMYFTYYVEGVEIWIFLTAR